MRGRLAAVTASFLASAACVATLITNDQSAKAIIGNESIDIQPCRLLADLTVCFLIETDLLFLSASILEKAPN